MSDQLKRTPLYAQHIAAGAKMVDFGGFEMPLKYTSETAEHMAVRTSVGMFDVSHMGEVFVEGPRALDAIAHLVTNDPAQIKDGQAMYAGMLNERGTFVDDVVVYRFNTSRFLVVVNAGNRDKDRGHIFASINGAFGADTVARDEGDRWAQLAVQGPKAVDVVTRLCASSELASTARALGNYWFTSGALKTNDGVVNNTIISRTGYTGEDGYEIYVEANNAPMVWDAVLATGTDFGLVPCGLACRDTLRLEAGMCLYGNDIDEDHTPLEANLGFIVKGSSFIGKPALDAQKAAGTRRLLRGLTVVDRGIARHGYSVHDAAGAQIGVVTSGTQAPFVNKPIAMAYLDRPHTDIDSTVYVDVRGKKLASTVSKLPFYKRAR